MAQKPGAGRFRRELDFGNFRDRCDADQALLIGEGLAVCDVQAPNEKKFTSLRKQPFVGIAR